MRTHTIDHFNFDNHKWYDFNLDIHFNIHNHTVKRIYWLQIPKKMSSYKISPKDSYWNEALSGIPPIKPNSTYRRINKNIYFSLKVRAIAHAFIFLEFYFGPQCLHMTDITHLAHCQRCMPEDKCPCINNQCTIVHCKCACHIPTTHYNSPYHTIFCTTLIPMLATILKITKITSIILPFETHQKQWALVTSDLGQFQKQLMRQLWYNIYAIYIQIIYRTHYNPLQSPKCYQKEFLDKTIHQMKIAHLKLTKDLLKNEASLDTPKNIDDKNRSLNADFCKIWTHPHMSTLDEDNTLIINLKHDEVEDEIYQTCIQEATWLTQQSHLYHTQNH